MELYNTSTRMRALPSVLRHAKILLRNIFELARNRQERTKTSSTLSNVCLCTRQEMPAYNVFSRSYAVA